MRATSLIVLLVTLALAAPGCGSSQSPPPTFADPDDPAYAAAQDTGQTDPRVSTSRGEPGGYVVLWPRIVPADPDGAMSEMASMIQNRLVAMTQQAAEGGHPIDVRPEPERVCPRAGCEAASVGALLMHVRGACAVVATTRAPGTGRGHLDAWAGDIDVINANPQFRDPPEDHVRVEDFVRCTDLAAALDEHAEEILLSIRAARRSR